MRTCTRCHAPAGYVELTSAGTTFSFPDLTHGAAPESVIGRDGVTCSLCHQIEPAGLGTPTSFTGGYVIGESRTIFGPHDDPFTMPMQNRVDYTPVASAHTRESGLCGSCHTVVTRSLDSKGAPTGPELLEQGPFVEWSVSSYAQPGGQSCQSCHMPSVDDDGDEIATVLATRPPNRLVSRSPIGRHDFAGANAFMLRLLAGERDWAGIETSSEALLAQAERAEASLRTAATVAVARAERTAAGITVRIRVKNLHRAQAADGVSVAAHVAACPRRRRAGQRRLRVRRASRRAHRRFFGRDRRPDAHRAPSPRNARRLVRDADLGAVPGDAQGASATTLLDATRYLKDERILPLGFDATDPRAALALPVGVEATTTSFRAATTWSCASRECLPGAGSTSSSSTRRPVPPSSSNSRRGQAPPRGASSTWCHRPRWRRGSSPEPPPISPEPTAMITPPHHRFAA
jgi:hypothetical protein